MGFSLPKKKDILDAIGNTLGFDGKIGYQAPKPPAPSRPTVSQQQAITQINRSTGFQPAPAPSMAGPRIAPSSVAPATPAPVVPRAPQPRPQLPFQRQAQHLVVDAAHKIGSIPVPGLAGAGQRKPTLSEAIEKAPGAAYHMLPVIPDVVEDVKGGGASSLVPSTMVHTAEFLKTMAQGPIRYTNAANAEINNIRGNTTGNTYNIQQNPIVGPAVRWLNDKTGIQLDPGTTEGFTEQTRQYGAVPTLLQAAGDAPGLLGVAAGAKDGIRLTNAGVQSARRGVVRVRGADAPVIDEVEGIAAAQASNTQGSQNQSIQNNKYNMSPAAQRDRFGNAHTEVQSHTNDFIDAVDRGDYKRASDIRTRMTELPTPNNGELQARITRLDKYLEKQRAGTNVEPVRPPELSRLPNTPSTPETPRLPIDRLAREDPAGLDPAIVLGNRNAIADNAALDPVKVTVVDGRPFVEDGKNRTAAFEAEGHDTVPISQESLQHLREQSQTNPEIAQLLRDANLDDPTMITSTKAPEAPAQAYPGSAEIVQHSHQRLAGKLQPL